MKGVCILIFGDNFSPDEVIVEESQSYERAVEQARYWVERRYEKSRQECTAGYYAERTIDVKKMIDACDEAEAKYYKEQQEMKDQQEYERLKKKFESQD